MRTTGVLFFVFALCMLGISAPLEARTKPHPHHVVMRVAPADEYFGRLKMSILGIRNQLHDLALRLQYTPNKGEDVLGSATMVEDALHDWEHKYPADPWLPRSVYDLTTLYSNVHTAHGHVAAVHALRWMLARYGRTHYGALARAQIKPHVGLR